MEVRDLFESLDYGAAPESTDRAMEWLKARGNVLDHYIGGEFTMPAEGEYFPTHSPSNGKLLATVADGSEKDVNRAVAAAVASGRVVARCRTRILRDLLAVVTAS